MNRSPRKLEPPMWGSHTPVPPPKADALLHRWLPDGVLGLSIIGDLHQEYAELVEAGMGGAADRWYWRSAITLSGRYAAIRLRNGVLDRRLQGPRWVALL